ncbi:protachykinin-1-like isoform X1 [Pleurodeles waltl]|uniref:protachykinin-1-like isoform X1 n=1 Tax=Pleurodeles waltl TaxID=8319 RepID=UPI0037093E2A
MKFLGVFAALLLSTKVLSEELGIRDSATWRYNDQVQSELQSPLLKKIIQRIAIKQRQNELYGPMAKQYNAPKGKKKGTVLAGPSGAWELPNTSTDYDASTHPSQSSPQFTERKFQGIPSKKYRPESFIALMGKRSLDSGSADWTERQNAVWEYK